MQVDIPCIWEISELFMYIIYTPHIIQVSSHTYLILNPNDCPGALSTETVWLNKSSTYCWWYRNPTHQLIWNISQMLIGLITTMFPMKELQTYYTPKIEPGYQKNGMFKGSYLFQTIVLGIHVGFQGSKMFFGMFKATCSVPEKHVSINGS